MQSLQVIARRTLRTTLCSRVPGVSVRGYASVAKGSAERNRFYETVSVVPKDFGWGIKLDKIELKTPSRSPLVLPTEDLAYAVAVEWDSQDKKVKPLSMPLMTLSATAIDLVPVKRTEIVESMVNYLVTDTVLYRAESPKALVQLQTETWDPLVQFMEDDFNCPLNVTKSFHLVRQPDESLEAVRRFLYTLDQWELAVVDSLGSCMKSLVHALAVYNETLTVNEAFESSRLDEEFQIKEWGSVEGGHDIDIADNRMRLLSTVLFMKLVKKQR
eukprot:GFYU01007174.1.p1 GENE.GFYU01007174.1~~GFYU01007174.1.p1  ORF type:complete len:272 (-),score=61.61 GFYU01007174.1:28-843(-)